MSREVPEYDLSLVAADRGLHELAKKEFDYDYVIDFDVADRGIAAAPFITAVEAQRELDRLQRTVPEGRPESALFAQKLAARIMILDVLSGKKVKFDKFIETTTGLEVEEVPQEEIDTLLETVKRQFDSFWGLTYDRDGAARFYKKFEVLGEENIKDLYEKAAVYSRIAMRRYIEVPKRISKVKIVHSPYPSKGAQTTDALGRLIRTTNNHPGRHYVSGDSYLEDFHERTHELMIRLWRNKIRSGQMSPALGLTSMTSRENTHLEGAAVAAEGIVPEVLSMETEAERICEDEEMMMTFYDSYHKLAQAMQHNANIRLNRRDDPEIIKAQLMEYLPLKEPAEIDGFIKAASSHPAAKASIAVYHPLRRMVEPIVGLPKNSPALRDILRLIFNNSFTVDQLREVSETARNSN